MPLATPNSKDLGKCSPTTCPEKESEVSVTELTTITKGWVWYLWATESWNKRWKKLKRSSNRSFLIYRRLRLKGGFPGGLVGKESACNPGDTEDPVSIPESGKIPCRRAWQPTPVFLPGESCGQRSLVGYSPWSHKESDTIEQLGTQARLRKETVYSHLECSTLFPLSSKSFGCYLSMLG